MIYLSARIISELAGNRDPKRLTFLVAVCLLSSCRFCDEIVVFDQGAVVQEGSHEELLADADGKYYELWHAQAQYYTEEAVRVLLG